MKVGTKDYIHEFLHASTMHVSILPIADQLQAEGSFPVEIEN